VRKYFLKEDNEKAKEVTMEKYLETEIRLGLHSSRHKGVPSTSAFANNGICGYTERVDETEDILKNFIENGGI
jgi:hypothetical protein